MTNRVPTLIGIGGSFRGECHPLVPFQITTVGRSRGADISLRRTQQYKMQTEAERDADVKAKTVSAQHFQITYFSVKAIEIKNLSVNGTRLDGKPVGDKVVVTDIEKKSHIISFGMDCKFKLIYQSVGSAPAS